MSNGNHTLLWCGNVTPVEIREVAVNMIRSPGDRALLEHFTAEDLCEIWVTWKVGLGEVHPKGFADACQNILAHAEPASLVDILILHDLFPPQTLTGLMLRVAEYRDRLDAASNALGFFFSEVGDLFTLIMPNHPSEPVVIH